MMQDNNLHDVLTTELEKFHHSEIGTVCRAVLTETDGALLDAALRSLVVQAVQLFTAQARREERHHICETLLKIVQESASDGAITHNLTEVIESLQKP
jgi:hypothetical protein